MVERVRRASRQALVIALVTLGTNAVQWATARSQERAQRRASERRDELLDSAYQRSVQALEDARKVLESAERRLAACGGAKVPQVMYRLDESEAQVVRPSAAPLDTPTARLDWIAMQEAVGRMSMAQELR